VTNKERHTDVLYCQEQHVSRHLVDPSFGMSKKTIRLAFSAETLEEVIKPDLRQVHDIEKKNWFPWTDTPEHASYDKMFCCRRNLDLVPTEDSTQWTTRYLPTSYIIQNLFHRGKHHRAYRRSWPGASNVSQENAIFPGNLCYGQTSQLFSHRYETKHDGYPEIENLHLSR
jgi:hypothetical protein